MRVNPHFVNSIKKLSDYRPEIWRCRMGGLWFFYTVNEKERVVYMLSVEPRKDSY
jgi:mRNA interferase RelE/StbE